MNIFTDKVIYGRPFFKDHNQLNKKPDKKNGKMNVEFISKNALLSKIAPTHYSLFQRIGDWIARKFQALFTFVQRPDFDKERNICFISKKTTSLLFSDILSHYRNFILNEKECPNELKRCLSRFEADSKECNRLKVMTQAAKWKDFFKNKAEAAKKALLTRKLSDLQKLKEGEVHLFDTGGNVCLWSQHKGKYTLEVLGPYCSMSPFQPKMLPLGGKLKIEKKVVFENIPASELFEKANNQLESKVESWLLNWIDPQMSPLNQAEWFKDFAKYRKQTTSIDQLKTQDDRMENVFWNSIASLYKVEAPAKSTQELKNDQKQIQLRAQLAGLFDFFKNERHKFSGNSSFAKIAELKKMHQNVSANCLNAYRKGFLNKPEFEEIHVQLQTIAKALQEVKFSGVDFGKKVPLKRAEIPSAKLNTLGAKPISLPVLKSAKEIFEKEIGSNKNLIPPQLTPLPPMKRIAQEHSIPVASLYSQINSKDEFLKHLRQEMLAAKQDQQEDRLLQLLLEVPFAPYKDAEDRDDMQNKNSFWWNFTPEEKKEIMESIFTIATNKFSGDYKVKAKIRAELSRFHYDALIKMTWMVVFIESNSGLGGGLWQNHCGDAAYLCTDFKNYVLGGENYDRFGKRKTFKYNPGRRKGERPYRKVSGESSLISHELYNLVSAMDRRFGHSTRVGKECFDLLENSFVKKMAKFIAGAVDQGGEGRVRRDFDYKDAYYIEGIYEHYSPRWLPGEHKKWTRPINNLYLAALYRNASSHVTKDYDQREANPELDGPSPAPESFQAQPQARFEEFKAIYEELAKDNDCPIADREEIKFTEKEKQSLLRLLRLEDPQNELVAFIKECPHLFRYASVRNYFDSLFFNNSLHQFLLSANNLDLKYLEVEIPQQIQEAIDRFERLAEKERLEADPSEERLKHTFEALVYFYEMKEKLRAVYLNHYSKSSEYALKGTPLSTKNFSSSLEAVRRLRELSLTDKRLSTAAASTALIHFKILSAENHLSAESLPEVIFDYMLISEGPRNQVNIDPEMEQELRNKWNNISGALKRHENKIPIPSIKLTLDYLCYFKGLTPTGEWVPAEGSTLKFKNGDYTVDLESMLVSITSGNKEMGGAQMLPNRIAKDPSFLLQFPNCTDNIPAYRQMINAEAVYTMMYQGCRHHIAFSKLGELRFYTEIKMDKMKLVQRYSPPVASAPPTSKNFLEKFLDDMGDLIPLKQKIPIQANHLLPAHFFEHFYIDPSNPSQGYKLNEKNEVLLEIYFKESSSGLMIDYVIDRRTKNSAQWQVNTGQGIKHARLFKKIENPDQLLVWSQKGQIKKVELPRYGLIFAVNQKELTCLNEDLKGYKLVVNATAEEKQGIEFSLLLTHPDPTKPKKLLVPESRELVNERRQLSPKALSWFGHLFLAFENLRLLMRVILGKLELPLAKERLVFNRNSKKIPYSCLDLRPFTAEICFTNPVFDHLNLAEHALKTEQPLVAYKLVQKIDVNACASHPKTLKLMTQFIQKELAGTPAEAALKFKLCCQIYHSLVKKKRANQSLRAVLKALMIENGKKILKGGRKIPRELQLTSSELTQLGVIAKKNDLEFYVEHLQAHLLKKNSPVPLNKVNEERFAEVKVAWGKMRSDTTFEGAIQKLEKLLETVPLKEEDLRVELPRKEGVELLFSPKEVEFLFKSIKPELPDLKLQRHRKLNKASIDALEEFQKELDDYRQKELERPLFEIQVSPQQLRTFSDKKLKPKLDAYTKQASDLQNEIEHYMHASTSAVEQVAIYGGEKKMTGLDSLREALANNSLSTLQEKGCIPTSADLAKLRGLLINYFELLSRRHAAAACLKAIDDLAHSSSRSNPVLWRSISTALYRMLTIQRHYDPLKDPRPLIFEAQQLMNFRCLDGGIHQLDLLDELMRNPSKAIQAPTGAGKTSVLSVMRSLLKANGKNLVIQKVTSALYNQTYDKLKETLGDLFGRAVYPLKFNLKKPMVETLTKTVKNDQGVKEEVQFKSSIFKKMYLELLEVIQSKGCVLTDYKSLPLIEEKFWKLSLDMLEAELNGQEILNLDREHFIYLKKILNLLLNRADENMDEFDQPNRPINKIQIDLGAGSHLIPPYLVDHSVEIYQELLADPILQLRKNIQGDLTEKMRLESIERVATKMAAKISQANGLHQYKLLEYFLGKNEAILNDLADSQEFNLLDQIALYKDQFSTYLPLTLRGKNKGRYDRSDDGERTIPCFNGIKHEAKHGTLLEQINYTIQNYLQGGINTHDYQLWCNELRNEMEAPDENSPRKQLLTAELQRILPGSSFADLGKPKWVHRHIRDINQDSAKVIEFLKTRLGKLKTGGAVISMGPLDVINMNRTTSGMSATSGAPEALHNQFQVDLKQKGAIRANMAMRLCQRAESLEVLRYDPLNPMEVIQAAQKKAPLTAIIDGAGLFNENAEAAVSQLLKSPKITQVGCHEKGAIVYKGASTSKIDATGFLFTQAQTRGTDISLAPDARALLTLTETDSIADFFQKEGRLRIETQRYLLAIPKYQTKIKYIQQAISEAICVETNQNGNDIYRKCKQELQAILRKEMRNRLLSIDTLEAFLELFKNPEISKLFITPPGKHYEKRGDYFRAHRHIRREDCDPKVELEVVRQKKVKIAEKLNLAAAKICLNVIRFTSELVNKMPEKVSSEKEEELEMECEVEVEAEMELEVEQHLEIEVEVEREVEESAAPQLIQYPLRRQTKLEHILAKQTEVHYDDKIYFSNAFLPLSRKDKASLLKRNLWDDAMFRVGSLRVYLDLNEATAKLLKVVIDDPVEEGSIDKEEWSWKGRRRDYRHRENLKESQHIIKYDLRTGKVTEMSNEVKNLPQALACKEVVAILAQIKFFDGKTSGYSLEEIKSLKQWIALENKEKMRLHMIDTILRYRPDERKRFEGSQLQLEVLS